MPRRAAGSSSRRPRARAAGSSDQPGRRPFDFDVAFARIARTLEQEGHAPAAMFALAAEGHRSLFEQLVACVISIRTRDEVSLPVSRRLLSRARTPAGMARLASAEIDALIGASTFHEAKARTILEIARRTAEEFGGELPCDAAVLTSFHGVGPKCANLALGIACGQARISVDIHVHRVTNRWGVVRAASPERTMVALEEVLPPEHRVEINRLLVPFGKHVCTGRLPSCSTCPVLDMCRQVGVTTHR
jgi:endonuclease-3